VQYLTEKDDRDLPVPITRCQVWRRAVNDGRYTYVVAAGNPLQKQLPPEVAWTAPGPATEVAVRDGTSVVFRVDGRLDPGDCP
jgi:hypothetical protein